MRRFFVRISFAAMCASALVGLGCGESTEDVCDRACDRWVNQCGRWNWDDCMSECMAEGDWGEYADCIERAPCNMLDAICDD